MIISAPSLPRLFANENTWQIKPGGTCGQSPKENFGDLFQRTAEEIQKSLQSRMATAAGILKGDRKENGAPGETGSANSRQKPAQDKTAPAPGQDTAPQDPATFDAAASNSSIPGDGLNKAVPGSAEQNGRDAPPESPAAAGKLSFEACGIISGEYIIASEASPEAITPEAAKAPPGEKEREAQEKEKELQDKLRAEEIYTRMKAERELHNAKMQAILAELQTEIRRIWDEVMLRRQKVHDEMLKNWHKVFLG